jgi:ComF family protein
MMAIHAAGKYAIDSLRDLAGGIVDLVLPATCNACRAAHIEAEGLCKHCSVELLSLVARSYCHRCGASLGPGIPASDDGCDACPPTLGRFSRVVRLGSYRYPLKQILRHWKYARQDRMVPRLAELLAQGIRAAGIETDLVVSVPMHWQRRLLRGHDHAAVLGRRLADQLDLPLIRALKRTRAVSPQVHLPRTRRIENVKGSMAAIDPDALATSRVLLVDDVTTTGATADEAARICLRAGASSVVLAVAAKAEPPRAYAHGRSLR